MTCIVKGSKMVYLQLTSMMSVSAVNLRNSRTAQCDHVVTNILSMLRCYGSQVQLTCGILEVSYRQTVGQTLSDTVLKK